MDLSRSHDPAILWHVHSPVHVLQCPEGEEGQLQNKRRLHYNDHEEDKAQAIWSAIVDFSRDLARRGGGSRCDYVQASLLSRLVAES